VVEGFGRLALHMTGREPSGAILVRLFIVDPLFCG